MKWSLRFALSAFTLLLILLLSLKSHFEDFWDQYSVGSYVHSSWKNTFRHGAVEHNTSFHGEPGDRAIVMAKLEEENTNWVTEHLPEYCYPRLTPTSH